MRRRIAVLAILWLMACCGLAHADNDASIELNEQLASTVRPFLETYCVSCHGGEEPEAGLDLAGYSSLASVLHDGAHLPQLVERLTAEDMPPADAEPQPTHESRQAVVDWLQSVLNREMQLHAGDPGLVLARRLSNSEYNYTIRDLTGVDIQPTREFPIDPANTAGFDNSGESLSMSSALLTKYLQAAREVANHMFLRRDGFAFAPHPMLAETDRDKYCVQQIIDFYHRQNTDYVDYFLAAWRFKHRAELGQPQITLAEVAAQAGVSPKYLATIWSTLEGSREEIGPLVKLQTMWQALPAPEAGEQEAARGGCERMRDYVVELRKKVEPRFLNIEAGSVRPSSQPLLIWKNVQYATHRLTFDPAQLQVAGETPLSQSNAEEPGADNEFGPGYTRLIKNTPGDPDLVVPAGQRAQYEAAFAKFCRVFPDKFYMEERGRNYFDTTQDRGRYLSAGFHSLMGYFRDDLPLYTLLLDEQQQKELDEMWFELDFIAAATSRMYIQFYAGGRREGRGLSGDEERDKAAEAVPTDTFEITSEAKIKEMEATFLKLANDGPDVGIQAIQNYFRWINQTIRATEKARLDAEPAHLQALLRFAARAYRRPLSEDEKNDLLAFYRSARETDALDHEAALRESIVAVLMSPDLCYRIDLLGAEAGIQPLSDYDLASRLSYFLWSSLPDDELLAHAEAGDLHEPAVLAAEARRMLQDARIRALAVEFGGNWLDFRRFQDLNTVDRERFSSFTDELRAAMYEEPIRFLVDVFQNNRPLIDLLYASDTFVNRALAKHYRMPVPQEGSGEWTRIDDADEYGRGSLLPMAVFLTKNSPGLRTSPVKRGNWVVKNVLGERIPPPPPVVPELPRDEAELDLPLREVLARHRADPGCAACHARFDSFGLAFEGFGPIGERRELDLAGRPVDVSATFPDGSDGAGLEGLREYIRAERQDDFLKNFCGKLLAFALGRSLMMSDEILIQQMCRELEANDYRVEVAIELIVTSPQFLTKRGQAELAER